MIFAILHERVSIVKYFIHEKNASLSVPVDGLLPIHYACVVGNFEILNEILSTDEGSQQVNIQNQYLYTPLHMAVSNSHLKCVILLLKYGAVTNFAGFNQRIPESGNTPLHICARLSDTKIAEALLSKGASLKITNSYNETPIEMCKKFGNEKMGNYFQSIKENPSLIKPFPDIYEKYISKSVILSMQNEIAEMKKVIEDLKNSK